MAHGGCHPRAKPTVAKAEAAREGVAKARPPGRSSLHGNVSLDRLFEGRYWRLWEGVDRVPWGGPGASMALDGVSNAFPMVCWSRRPMHRKGADSSEWQPDRVPQRAGYSMAAPENGDIPPASRPHCPPLSALKSGPRASDRLVRVERGAENRGSGVGGTGDQGSAVASIKTSRTAGSPWIPHILRMAGSVQHSYPNYQRFRFDCVRHNSFFDSRLSHLKVCVTPCNVFEKLSRVADVAGGRLEGGKNSGRGEFPACLSYGTRFLACPSLAANPQSPVPRTRPSRCGRSWRPPRRPPRNRRSCPSRARPARCRRGSSRRRRSRRRRRAANCRRAASSPPSRPAMHISPRTSRFRKLGQSRQQRLDLRGGRPCLAGSAETFTSTRTGIGHGAAARADPPARAASSSMAAASRRLSTAWMQWTQGRVRRTLFRCKMADQVPADRQIGQRLGPFPKLLRPVLAQVGEPAATAARISRGPTDLVTTTSRTSSARRPERAAASAIRPRISARFRPICATGSCMGCVRPVAGYASA